MKHKTQQIFKFVAMCTLATVGVTMYALTGGTWIKAIVLWFVFSFMHIITNVAYHRWLAHRYIEPGIFGKTLMLYCVVVGGLVKPLHYVIGHRLHHRYPDTDLDPHPPSIGFFNALIGNFNEIRTIVDFRDVSKDPLINFVNRHYYKLYFFNLLVWCFIDIQVVMLSFALLNLRLWYFVTGFNYHSHGGKKQTGPLNLTAYHSFLLGWLGEQLHKNHHDDPSNPNFGRLSPMNFDVMYHILKRLTKTRQEIKNTV
jgi:stearoyl-CoA desaturase (delta-9 desaturase)